ncbi:MAG: HAMP domain-containing protein [Gammaproteobacteria bacterium]|nr:HAMP domain-containing protein [Gammaproteobacteria bacterium]
MSLRIRLLLLVTLSLGAAVLVSVAALSVNARDSVLAQMERDVGVLARVLAQTVALSERLPEEMESRLGEEMLTMSRILARYVAAAEAAGTRPGAIIEELRHIIAAGTLGIREILGTVVASRQGRTVITAEGVDVYAPILGAEQEMAGAFFVRLPRGALDELLAHQLRAALLVGVAILGVGGLLSYWFADRLARPIARVTAAAERVYHGDFKLEDLAPTGEQRGEIGRLATVFHSMARQVENRERALDEMVAQRTHELAEKNEALEQAQAQINAELDVARALQIAILPHDFPAMGGSSAAAFIEPARYMGGDFYDFIELPGGRIGLVVADVSGKGVTAAFFMAVARTNLRLMALETPEPGLCMARANDVLCTQNPKDLFVTVFYAVFDPLSGELRYANGGHNPPFIRRASGTVEMLPSLAGLGLGIMPDIAFDEAEVTLGVGEHLVLYSDGITEAMNEDFAEFGTERLIEAIATHPPTSSQSLVDAIILRVREFVGVAPQTDDITLAVVTRGAG